MAQAFSALTLQVAEKLAAADIAFGPSGEVYVADLIGLAVEHADGRALGRVKSVQNFGAGDLVEITSGLKAGERVATTNVTQLVDGVRIIAGT